MSRNTLKRRMGDDCNYLFPEAIYAFHRELHEIWDDYGFKPEDGDKKAIVIPSLFSKHTRTFHWLAIAVKNWAIDPHEIISEIRKSQTSWGGFCANLASAHALRHTKEAVEYVSSYLANGSTIPKEERIPASRHLLALYEGYHHDPRLYLDGIIFRNLEKLHEEEEEDRSKKIDYFVGHRRVEVDKKKEERSYVKHAWTEESLFFDRSYNKECGKLRLEKFQCQESKESTNNTPKPLCPEERKRLDEEEHREAIAALLLDKFFTEPINERTQPGVGYDYIIIVPIYDAWIGNESWGSLCGNLTLLFRDEDELTWYQNEKLDTLMAACQRFSQEFTRSGTMMVLNEPIEPPYDLVDHFVKNLKIVQDWERIIVYWGEEPQYCYRWHDEGSTNDESDCTRKKWVRCDPERNRLDRSRCDFCLVWKETKNPKFLRWEQKLMFWDGAFLPDIGNEEKEAFHDIRLAFEYPLSACIPNDEGKRKMLGEEYIRQQLEILRGLMPKVRARRAALRNAVSAIMGRNMSHNIGSHVLARYGIAIKDDLDSAEERETDHLCDFLGYLQRRMDFLAEVATSDRAYWAQPFSLEKSLSKLNYKTQKARIVTARSGGNDNEKGNEPILLSYITGKESLKASVKFGRPTYNSNELETGEANYTVEPNGDGAAKQNDLWFSCPGGEVGVHALYVILENIIRNSARHGGDNTGEVKLFVWVNESESTPDLLKLVIIDPRTQLEWDGCVEGETETVSDEERKLCDGRHSLFKRDGKRKKLVRLHNEINSILRGEPFLDENGNPNPHYWGVREMQICAYYLRGIPLSEIESIVEREPVLRAGIHTLTDGVYCLKYELYLQRAKLLAVVTTDSSLSGSDDLTRQGILIYKPNALSNATTLSDDDWKGIFRNVRGFAFVKIQQEIGIPHEHRTQLPVRTHQMSHQDIKKVLTTAAKRKDLSWMESLHRIEGERYQNKRKCWNGKKYWGLQALLKPHLDETTNGIWRQVKLDLNQNDGNGVLRAMWPLQDEHQAMIDTLENDIAALWIDHPKPVHYEGRNPKRPALGESTRIEQAATPPENDFVSVRRWVHLEGVVSDSPHKNVLEESHVTHCREVLAAALPRVAVLDERVQSAADTEIWKIRLDTLWPSMGVWVPRKSECNLDHPERGKLRAFLEKPTTHLEHWPVDFLILHLTILERLHKAPEQISKTFEETLSGLTKDTQAEGAQLVVVTGRGVPSITRPDDPDYLSNVRYLPVSVILEYLVARPSKLALMRVLWSAARPQSR